MLLLRIGKFLDLDLVANEMVEEYRMKKKEGVVFKNDLRRHFII